MSEDTHIEKNPNVRCLFTENDWKDWEEIDKRTKSRGSGYKAGLVHTHTQQRVICILCNKNMAISHLRRHRETSHKEQFSFKSWAIIVKYENDCREAYLNKLNSKSH